MRIELDKLSDQPEEKIRELEEAITKRIQYREKGRTLKFSQEYIFDDLTLDKSFTNDESKSTILFCEEGAITFNGVRTMTPSDILICSSLGKTYNMHSETPSGGKIYAFI